MQEQLLSCLTAKLSTSEFLCCTRQVHRSGVLCLLYNCVRRFLSKSIRCAIFSFLNEIPKSMWVAHWTIQEVWSGSCSGQKHRLSLHLKLTWDYQLNPFGFLHPLHWIPVPMLNFLCSTSFYSFFNCLDLLDKISELTVKMCDQRWMLWGLWCFLLLFLLFQNMNLISQIPAGIYSNSKNWYMSESHWFWVRTNSLFIEG